jgi:alpha 1,3-glucosidase
MSSLYFIFSSTSAPQIKISMVFFSVQGAKYASVYLPGKELWYDIRTGDAYKGGKTHKLEAAESVPAFQRAGTIIPRKDRLRRSSTQMVNDPYTLVCS